MAIRNWEWRNILALVMGVLFICLAAREDAKSPRLASFVAGMFVGQFFYDRRDR